MKKSMTAALIIVSLSALGNDLHDPNPYPKKIKGFSFSKLKKPIISRWHTAGNMWGYTEYLPLTGGTLTGDLIGINAYFTGNVGIGTTSAPDKLTVLGPGFFTDGSHAGVRLGGDNSYGWISAYDNTISNSKPLVLQTNGGSVGIGTNNPASLVEVRKDQSAMTQIILNNAYTTGASTRFSMYRGSTEIANLQVNGTNNNLLIANRTIDADANINFSLSDGIYNVTFRGNGNVGIGVTVPSEKLCVNGNIKSKKSIVTQVGWSDYVFSDDYHLRPLSEVARYIKENRHLPEIPSAKEVEEQGVDLGANQALLLKKIEELTLYIIKQQSEIDELKTKNYNK